MAKNICVQNREDLVNLSLVFQTNDNSISSNESLRLIEKNLVWFETVLSPHDGCYKIGLNVGNGWMMTTNHQAIGNKEGEFFVQIRTKIEVQSDSFLLKSIKGINEYVVV